MTSVAFSQRPGVGKKSIKLTSCKNEDETWGEEEEVSSSCVLTAHLLFPERFESSPRDQSFLLASRRSVRQCTEVEGSISALCELLELPTKLRGI